MRGTDASLTGVAGHIIVRLVQSWHKSLSACLMLPISTCRYDIKSLSSDRTKESCDGIEESRATIMKLIAEETATGEGKPGLAASRIALAGFSQGGAMSLFVGLNYPQTLAGMVVLSGYLPLPDSVKPTAEALATPLLHCHGDEDGVVPLAYGRDAHDRVKTMGVKDPQFKVYEGLPHSVSPSKRSSTDCVLSCHVAIC